MGGSMRVGGTQIPIPQNEIELEWFSLQPRFKGKREGNLTLLRYIYQSFAMSLED